ncbi:MAG: DUF4236 domain-containing protein [Polyangiaceae bacterium]
MGFRFWRRIKILPGVTLNLSKSGASVSLGPRGAKFTVGPSGARATAGISGTGLFYTKKLGTQKRKKRRGGTGAGGRPGVEADVDGPLEPGFIERMFLDDEAEALLDGCRAIFQGDTEQALEHLSNSEDPDACFLEAALCIKTGDFDRALVRLDAASRSAAVLGESLARSGISVQLSLPITDEISAQVQPNERGLLLARVEALQLAGQTASAMPALEELLVLEPDDVVVKLSLAELLMENGSRAAESVRRALELTEGVENNSPICTALLLYRARALNHLGLHEAARTTCTIALRRRKNREPDLLNTVRYERALAYEGLGQARRSRSDLERIFAADANFMDIAEKLGL